MSDITSSDQAFPFGSPAQPTFPAAGGSESSPVVHDPADVFLSDGAAPDSAQDDTLPIPGPGIPEALLWMIGMLVVHLIGSMIAGLFVVLSHLSTLSSPPSTPQQWAAEATAALQGIPQDPSKMLTLMTGEMGFFVVVAVIAVAMRLGVKTSGRRLGLTPIPPAHFMLIMATAIPLSLMCGAFHQATTEVWNNTAARWPLFEGFEGMDVNETLAPLGEHAPLWLLVLVVAVAPAIGEEVVFRGVIGRGLIARHGLMAGVAMTSLMFAAVHIHPAHAIALLPLAFFIHLVYLATRSFWAPVLLHLLNNSLAAVLLNFASRLEGSGLAEENAVPLALVLVSGAIVAMSAVALWKSRLEYRRESDGSLWNPGYDTVEVPPESAGAVAVHRDRPATLIALTIVFGALYTAAFVGSVVIALSQ